MSKRLQIVMDDAEYREFQKLARRHRVTLSAWVRDVLRLAGRQEPRGDADRKLAVIRSAVRHEFPTADIDDMLAQIEAGYLGGEPR